MEQEDQTLIPHTPFIAKILEKQTRFCFPKDIFIDPSGYLQKFTCAMDFGVFRDPVIDSCGHTFGRQCLEQYIESGKNQCPISSKQFKETQHFQVNISINMILNEWSVKCLTYQEGCSWQGQLQHLESHLANECLNMEVQCPNKEAGCDKTVCRKDINLHADKDCWFQVKDCLMKSYGCSERMVKNELVKHMGNCHFELAKSVFDNAAKLESQVKSMAIQIDETKAFDSLNKELQSSLKKQEDINKELRLAMEDNEKKCKAQEMQIQAQMQENQELKARISKQEEENQKTNFYFFRSNSTPPDSTNNNNNNVAAEIGQKNQLSLNQEQQIKTVNNPTLLQVSDQQTISQDKNDNIIKIDADEIMKQSSAIMNEKRQNQNFEKTENEQRTFSLLDGSILDEVKPQKIESAQKQASQQQQQHHIQNLMDFSVRPVVNQEIGNNQNNLSQQIMNFAQDSKTLEEHMEQERINEQKNREFIKALYVKQNQELKETPQPQQTDDTAALHYKFPSFDKGNDEQQKNQQQDQQSQQLQHDAAQQMLKNQLNQPTDSFQQQINSLGQQQNLPTTEQNQQKQKLTSEEQKQFEFFKKSDSYLQQQGAGGINQKNYQEIKVNPPVINFDLQQQKMNQTISPNEQVNQNAQQLQYPSIDPLSFKNPLQLQSSQQFLQSVQLSQGQTNLQQPNSQQNQNNLQLQQSFAQSQQMQMNQQYANNQLQYADLLGHTGTINDIIYLGFIFGQPVMASCANDHSVRLWNINNAKCVQILQGHTDYVYKLAFAPIQCFVISASSDSTIRVWDIQKGQCVRIIRGHVGKVRALSFFSSSSLLLSGGEDKKIKASHVVNQQISEQLAKLDGEVTCMSMGNDTQKYFSAGDSLGNLYLLSSEFKQKQSTFKGLFSKSVLKQKKCYNVSILKSECIYSAKLIATCSIGQAGVKLWSDDQLNLVRELSLLSFGASLNSFYYCPKSEILLIGGSDEQTIVIDAKTFEKKHAFVKEGFSVCSLCWGLDLKTCASSGSRQSRSSLNLEYVIRFRNQVQL